MAKKTNRRANGTLGPYSPYGAEFLKFHNGAPRDVRENALALLDFAVGEYAGRAVRYGILAAESQREIDRLEETGKRLAERMRGFPRAQLSAMNRNTSDLLAETRHKAKLRERADLYRHALAEARKARAALAESLGM